jgi:hypothetical protein
MFGSIGRFIAKKLGIVDEKLYFIFYFIVDLFLKMYVTKMLMDTSSPGGPAPPPTPKNPPPTARAEGF